MNRDKNITISDKTFTNVYHVISSCSNILYRNCTFTGCNVRVIKSSKVRFQNCSFIRSGRFKTSALQYISSTGSVAYCYFEEEIGKSKLADIVNFFKCYATSDAPIIFEHNYVIGGGPHPSGGGVMLGDNGGHWQIARNNIVINPGQYGMAIAGGDKHTITENTVLASRQTWTNVGIYVWGIPQRNSFVRDSTITNNKISFTNRKGVLNNFWRGDRTSNITISNNVNIPFRIPARPPNVGAT